MFDTRAGTYSHIMDLAYPINAHWFELVDGGYKYRDIDFATYDGLRHGVIKSTRRERSKIVARASGDRLPAPAPVSATRWLSQLPEVLIQLVDSEGNCWETTFGAGTARVNSPHSFTAKTR
jgi:hypothetical protein